MFGINTKKKVDKLSRFLFGDDQKECLNSYEASGSAVSLTRRRSEYYPRKKGIIGKIFDMIQSKDNEVKALKNRLNLAEEQLIALSKPKTRKKPGPKPKKKAGRKAKK